MADPIPNRKYASCEAKGDETDHRVPERIGFSDADYRVTELDGENANDRKANRTPEPVKNQKAKP